MFPLLIRAFFKLVTKSKPLNVGEKDQPPPNGCYANGTCNEGPPYSSTKDYEDRVWAMKEKWERESEIYDETAKDLPGEESFGADF